MSIQRSSLSLQMNNVVTRRKVVDRLHKMKILKRTSYIMIMLILFQSFSAVANSLDFHSIDSQHLQHEHDHAEHDNRLSKTNDQDTNDNKNRDHNPDDCHHCGHCSGSHLSWVLVSNSNCSLKIHSINRVPYQLDNINKSLHTILRPPIS